MPRAPDPLERAVVSVRFDRAGLRHWLPRLALAAAILAAGIVAGRLVGLHFAPSTSAPPGLTGDAVYGMTLPDLEGTPQSLRQWQGKVLVVNFWATWCVPCREEMPALVSAQAKYGGQGLQIVGIGIDDAAKMRQFTRSIHLNYPALDGGFGALEMSKALGNDVMALPFTLVIDRKGAIAKRQLGPMDAQFLAAIATQLL
jgi:thiol-disulfide isomerase/thioredoxin